MNQLEKFAEVVRYYDDTYQRSMNEALFENFFWRNPMEIKDSGEVHYLCCTERTLMVSQHALEQGLEHKLMLVKIEKSFRRIKFGTAIEINLDGIDYTFISGNKGSGLVPGIRSPVKGKRPIIYTVNGSLDDSLSYFSHFGIDSVEELERYIPGLNFNRFVRKLRRRSGARSLKRYKGYIAKHKAERKHGLLVT